MGQGVTCYLYSFPFLFLFNQPKFFFSSFSLHAGVDHARTVESANQFMRQTALRAFVEKDTREGNAKKVRFLYFSLYNILLLWFDICLMIPLGAIGLCLPPTSLLFH